MNLYKLNRLFYFSFFCLYWCALNLGQVHFIWAEGPSLEKKNSEKVVKYCEKMDRYFKKYQWQTGMCSEYAYEHVRDSVFGDPLVWVVYQGEKFSETDSKDTTLVLCGVHGDEITPVKFCYDFLNFLKQSLSEKDSEFHKKFVDKRVVVAPLVNPDSFFKARPSRTNARGIDVNRNFPTKDWRLEAQKVWIQKYKRDKRRNPGVSPLSEPEVVFQVNLIKRYRPSKIISVHSPLSLIDYDGPSSTLEPSGGNKAEELLIQMSKDASDYKIQNYPFFPGSLGNWAGQEQNIPTYTLELPTSNPAKSDEYWALFKESMAKAIFQSL